MYIKLTRINSVPIWLNASFIVTVEPRKNGGSTVVPIGDGLDYDVKENPETVLAMLEGAPVPAVIPVPASDALTPTPDDVSPEDDGGAKAEPEAESSGKKPVRRRSQKKKETLAVLAEKEPTAGGKAPKTRRRKCASLLGEAELARLKKLAPGSMKKLQNTLVAQFKIEDAEAAVESLKGSGVVDIDKDRVIWK